MANGKAKINVGLLFSTSVTALKKHFGSTAERLAQTGMLCIARPKRASGVATDLKENLVGEIGLAEGLVGTTVCAIDETWSGLRFVIRLKDRK